LEEGTDMTGWTAYDWIMYGAGMLFAIVVCHYTIKWWLK
jgi:hypothetical protein